MRGRWFARIAGSGGVAGRKGEGIMRWFLRSGAGAGARWGPPVSMAQSVRGTRRESATWTARKPTMTDMPAKWMRRADWKPPSRPVSQASWTGFQMAKPVMTWEMPAAMTTR